MEEAIAWRRLGCSRPSQIREVRPYGLCTIREWVEAGFDPMQAAGYLKAGRTLDQLPRRVGSAATMPTLRAALGGTKTWRVACR